MRSDTRIAANLLMALAVHSPTLLYTNPSTELPIPHRAAANGDLDLIKTLIEELDIDLSITDSSGKTMLYYATNAGHSDVVTYLEKRKNEDLQKKLLLLATLQNCISCKEKCFSQISSPCCNKHMHEQCYLDRINQTDPHCPDCNSAWVK